MEFFKIKKTKEFVQALAHDFREPLRAITKLICLLEDSAKDRLNSDEKRYAYLIEEAGQKLSNMVNAFLALTKVSPELLEKSRFKMEDSVAQACVFLSPIIDESKATIRISKTLPCIFGDKSMFTILWQNLISNAIKFTNPSNRPLIHIDFINDVFTIRDNGIGIDAKYSNTIFDSFIRLTPKQHEGTGLGLYICKEIINLHKGEIWFESIPGEGTTFFFKLPRAEPC